MLGDRDGSMLDHLERPSLPEMTGMPELPRCPNYSDSKRWANFPVVRRSIQP